MMIILKPDIQLISLMAVILFLLSGCFESNQKALGTLEWDRTNGRAVVSENITRIHVKEGDWVKKGQALLQLDDRLQQAHVNKLAAMVEQARWQLRQLEAGYRPEDIASAKANLYAKTTAKKNNQINYRRQQNLWQEKLNSQKQLDDAKQQYEVSLGEEDVALQTVNVRLAGYRAEEIEKARAQLNAQLAELDYERLQLERYTLFATRSGKVDSLPYKLGDMPPMNAIVTTVLAGDRPWARVYLPETWLSLLSQGSEVLVNVDGLNRSLKGRVRFISSVPSFTPYYALSEDDRSRLMYITEIDLLDNAAKQLPLGVPVQMLYPSSHKETYAE